MGVESGRSPFSFRDPQSRRNCRDVERSCLGFPRPSGGSRRCCWQISRWNDNFPGDRDSAERSPQGIRRRNGNCQRSCRGLAEGAATSGGIVTPRAEVLATEGDGTAASGDFGSREAWGTATSREVAIPRVEVLAREGDGTATSGEAAAEKRRQPCFPEMSRLHQPMASLHKVTEP